MKIRILSFILLICLAISLTACTATQPTPASTQIPPTALSPTEPVATASTTETVLPTAESFQDGSLAREYLTAIAALGSRNMAQPTHQKVVDYLMTTLAEMGYSPTEQPFTNADGVSSTNVIAEKNGQSKQVIIAGAHFDNVDVGSGVDDNGSGVAVLLEVANRIQSIETPYTIRFVFFDSEETDLEGSGYYASQMTPEEVDNTIAMVNLDSLAVGDNTYIYGSEGDEGVIRDWALDYASQNNLSLVTQQGNNPDYPAGTTGDWSDHAPFRELGIQYVYFEATNWDLGELGGFIVG
jgi:alkaline phosphatase isozyme conversion protein